MEPLEFADRYLSPYKTNGDEIVPALCPFCHGGQSKDKYTFALNVEKRTYNCKRGSCGVQGHYTQLCREFGVEQESTYTPKVTYKKPKKKPISLTEAAEKYLRLRQISAATAEAYGVGVDENGNLMFPYYDENGEHVFNKFRYARKIQKGSGERKAWREADTKPVLFGMHLCKDFSQPLCITEGEFDALSCCEAGIPNAVSVPSGAEDMTWLDTCWDFIQRFSVIALFGDNDAPGQEMIRKLSVKFSDKTVCIVKHECKDANELLYRRGKEAVFEAWRKAEEVPVTGLLNLADVKPLDVTALESISTSIRELDKLIGGFHYGDVTVWTGKRGEGKSTLLSQLMLDAIQDGKRVCAYSGELRSDRYQYWTDLQAAGAGYIQEYYDAVKDRAVVYVPNAVKDKIHEWYDRKYWLYDNASANEESGIIEIFELAVKRYDCQVFLVDNLMTADYGKMSDKDFYRQQSVFVGHLVSFANKYNVHVHLVAHPRKVKDSLTADDISGSGDITNRAANVISLSKTSSGDAASLTLEVIKNRWEGNCGSINLNYCDKSHRLYVPGTENALKYGWDAPGFYEIESEGATWEDLTGSQAERSALQ